MADTQPDVQQQLVAEFSSLAHRHATVSYLLIGVMFVMFGFMGIGGYLGLKAYQGALSKAEQVEQTYQQQVQQFRTQIEIDQSERNKLEGEIAARDKEASKQKQQVSNITDPIKAVNELQYRYNGSLDFEIEPNGRVGFSVPSVNKFTQTKIDADAMASDINDLNAQINSLQLDLKSGQETLKACQDTVGAYKKAAKRSKWQKIIHGVEVGGLMVLSAAAGHVI